MQLNIPCPDCGNTTLHISRTRSTNEAMLHALTPFRICRCNFCNWRGRYSVIKIYGAKLPLTAGAIIIGLLAAGVGLAKFFS